MFIVLRPQLLLPLIIACVVLAFSAGTTRGDFVSAANLGSGKGFSEFGGYTLSGTEAQGGVGLSLAVRFTQGGPGASAFRSAQLALGHLGGANAVDILLMADLDGGPGKILETIRLAGAMTAATSLVTAKSVLTPTLMAGQDYWLAAVPRGDTLLTWATNPLGEKGHLAYQLTLGTRANDWLVTTNPDTAFAVTSAVLARPIVEAGAVPEPSSIVLCGIFGAVLVGARQFRPRA
ncbi:hypothetical protein TA3x_002189 [Tundrisphaera sp. TA3]|uniref:hypothetical protein n=1 Tax=Tundrisphaera sp. TA3 TaxID=3435775 RepID=UPI003EBD3FE4